MISFLGSITIFILGLVKPNIFKYLWLVALIYFLLYPFLFEILLNLKAILCIKCCSSRNIHQNCRDRFKNYYPIIYSSSYNISFCGLEKCHPFDS